MANFTDKKRLKNEKSIPMSYEIKKKFNFRKNKKEKKQIFNPIRNNAERVLASITLRNNNITLNRMMN